jgi:hypothetical protein
MRRLFRRWWSAARRALSSVGETIQVAAKTIAWAALIAILAHG